MDRRYINQEVAHRVAAAVTSSKCSKESVARAADMPVPDLDSRLTEAGEFSLWDLVRVGGFLRIAPSTFIEGIRA